MEKISEMIGLAAAVVMPFWNIPFIVRIMKRKSSEDISLSWLFGIWGCIVLMFPSTLHSKDMILRAFGLTNLVMFSGVVLVVLFYRNKHPKNKTEIQGSPLA